LGVLMRRLATASLVAAAVAAGATPASAQRMPFDRNIDVMPGATLDIATMRGKVYVNVHEKRQFRIEGTVTVRPAAGLRTSASPMDLARRVADRPRIEVEGNLVRMRPQIDLDERRAATVSYEVWVPSDTKVIVTTDTGAVEIDGIAGSVTVNSDSSMITLTRLTGKAEVKTESGDVKVDRASGGLSVVTESSAMTLRRLAGPLEARTQSGAVRASFADAGTADVETGSSAVELDGLSGRVAVRTQSGRVRLRGAPTADWNVTTGSSVIEAAFEPSAKFMLEATSSTSDVKVAGLTVDGSTATKGRVSGTVGGGGPTVRLSSRSGQIHIGH
jgi:DUF4097 and DUF4098 domain-containing protein YvlB